MTDKKQVHIYERHQPGWLFRLTCTCGNKITAYPIHETLCPDCHRKWQLDITARLTFDTGTTPPKQPSTTLVAFCPECFGMRMILCRENIVSDRPQAYWFACSDCGVETTHAPTLSAVRDMVRWVPIDATLD